MYGSRIYDLPNKKTASSPSTQPRTSLLPFYPTKNQPTPPLPNKEPASSPSTQHPPTVRVHCYKKNLTFRTTC